MTDTVISISKDVLGGTPVFTGTRVPVNTLIEYLEAGESIDQFLEGFPSVSKEMTLRFWKRLEIERFRLFLEYSIR